jgi:hypothetical protein
MTKAELIGKLTTFPDNARIAVRVAYMCDDGLAHSEPMGILTVGDEGGVCRLVCDGLDEEFLTPAEAA